jgi:hypothetical protein
MMSLLPTELPRRAGNRPRTTGLEIPHDQLDQPSPPDIRAALLEFAHQLPGTMIGQSLVSEPRSIGLRLPTSTAARDAFLWADEFAHVHASGFLHMALPLELIEPLIDAGWAEMHPITKRPEFPATIVMVYAPRDVSELAFVCDLIRLSYTNASGIS